jgi:diguanylate cyclase (GGDEF)-like protein
MTNCADAWSALLAGLPHAAWVADVADGSVLAANTPAVALFGATMVDAEASSLVTSPEDEAWWSAAAAGHAEPLHSDTVVVTADGDLLQVCRSIGLLPGGAQALVMLCDRSAEQRVENERESLLAELQATLEATADGILVTDAAGRITACNRRFAELWLLPAELLQSDDPEGMKAWMQSRVVDAAGHTQRLGALQADAYQVATDTLLLHGGCVLERVTRPLLRGGRAQGRVWSFRDLTAGLAAKERIETMASHDQLTGLPNRASLALALDAATKAARRDGSSYALMVVDLDRFRQINDSLGHEVGDRVLQAVAQRIQGCLRDADVLARIGGDQFAVLVQPADEAAAAAGARRILKVVGQPCSVDGAHFTLTCSIGMALAPSHGTGLDELGRRAEAAMRVVKGAGRAHFRLHQARAEGDRRQHMQLDHAMRQALASGRFRLHYQPQVSLEDGRIVGAEALMRWRDPELGDVPPGRFIPVAEDSGFIIAIGEWVLGQAVRQAALWHAKGYSVPIAVNVSALQFQQPQFVDSVAGALAVSGLPPSLLELELTESILVHDADEALHRLDALKRLGVQLSIDDFGTGYSSLAYLKRFPIGKLKIDRSFVHGLPGDERDTGIVRAILQMASAFGMKVIAEGVETEPQRQFLRAEGCDEFQGWLFAPALDSMSFEQRLLAAQPALPPAGQRIRLVRK